MPQSTKRTAPGAPAEVVKACAEAADKLFTDMKGVGWTAEHLAAVSKLAAPQLDHSGRGIVGLATVMGNAPDALWMQVEGSDKRFVVKVSPAVAQEPRGSHWLVLGLVTGNIAQIKDNHGNASQCRVLVSHYMFKVQ